MTYGLDECRYCGKEVRVTDPQARSRHEFYSRHKPTMTEEECRAAGWKAPPNRYQLLHRLDGLCYHCKHKRAVANFGRWRLALVSALVASAVLFLIFVALFTSL